MARRGENIYKRRDGRWEGRYIEAYSYAGRAKYRSVYGHTYKEVKYKLRNHIETQKHNGSDRSLCDWVREYIKLHRDKLKVSTNTVYERYYENHIYPFFKDMPIGEVDAGVLQEFVASFRELSASTVKGIFSLVRESLKLAYRAGCIEVVWLNVAMPKEKKASAYAFSKEEQQKIEKAVNLEENPNELGILICLYTGLRIGEVCGLRWEDINFISGTLSVRRTVQRISVDGKSQLLELPPKSESSSRKLPVPEFLLKLLENHRIASDDVYVLSLNSHIMDPRTYQNQYRRLLERAGVQYSNFHSLRHTFSVRALEAGFDIKTLSEILGHADAAITLKRYAHSLDEHKRESMERLSDICTIA